MLKLLEQVAANFESIENVLVRTRWIKLVGAYRGVRDANRRAGMAGEMIMIHVDENRLPSSSGEEDQESSSEIDEQHVGAELEQNVARMSVEPGQRNSRRALRSRRSPRKEVEDEDETLMTAEKGKGKVKRAKVTYLAFDPARHTIWDKPVHHFSLCYHCSPNFVHSVIDASVIPRHVSGQLTSRTGC
jgi:hypothetical protein